jgi:hypothetical protein
MMTNTVPQAWRLLSCCTAGKLLGSMLQPGDQVAIIFGRVDDIVMIDKKNGAKKVLEDIVIEIVTEQSDMTIWGIQSQ